MADVWHDFSTAAKKGFSFGHQAGDTVRFGPFPAKSNVGLFVGSNTACLGCWTNAACMNKQTQISSCVSSFNFRTNNDFYYCYTSNGCNIDPVSYFSSNPGQLFYSLESLNLRFPSRYASLTPRHFRLIRDSASNDIFISFNDWTGGFYTAGLMIARASVAQPHLPKLCSVVCDHGTCNYKNGTCLCQSGWSGENCSCNGLL